MGIWSSVCAALTLVTFLTYLLDPASFPYPERPIVTLSACYLMVATGYLLRMVVGYEGLACHAPVSPSSPHIPAAAGVDGSADASASSFLVLTRDGLGSNVGCAVVFWLTYYFSMAASIW